LPIVLGRIMPKTYEILPTIALNAGSTYMHPPALPEVAHLDDPALEFMVDFRTNYAFTIKPDAPVTHALIEMEVSGAHILLVVDQADNVVGIISSEHILGEKTIKLIHERRIPRHEVEVQMVMRPQADVVAFDYASLKHAKVGHVINTMRDARQHYALVVELEKGHQQTVRGMFSLSLLSKQLNSDYISDVPEARSIAELTKKLV
jgi:CBS domain-containing protein